MAEINILARKESKFFLTKIETEEVTKFDVAITEEHIRQSELTDLPVADGYTVSDHLIFKPEVYAVEGLISETPLKLLGGAIGSDDIDLTNAWKNVENLWREGAELTISTGLKVYERMICIGLTVPRDANTGQSIRIKANFKELRTAQTEIVNVDSNLKKGDADLAATASAKKDKGKVTPESSQQADNAESWAIQGFNFLDSIF